MVMFSGCSNQTLEWNLASVPNCWNLDLSDENIEARFEESYGIIQEITFYTPVENGTFTETPGEQEMEEHRIWVILPEDRTDLILQPCNLPEAQRIHNRRVAFSGQALKNHELETLEGVTPFNLQAISDGMDGPHSDVSC